MKPCPFCGNAYPIFANCMEMQICEDFRSCGDGHYFTAICSFKNKGCGASTGFYPTKEEAAAAWNERHTAGNAAAAFSDSD